MAEMKRNFKDSVFTYLFSEPKYTRELYLYLHPEDQNVTEDECRLITTENILAIGEYNDLGIQVRDKLILLVEAQSTLSPNMPLRMLMYLTSAYKAYIKENDLSLYSTKAMVIPRPELYMVYTGNQVHVPEVMRLADLYEGHGDADVTVKVLRGEDDSILGQYVAFCKIADEQRALYGLTRETIQETMRICQEQGILIPFLASRRKEVIGIMEMLFSQEEVWEMTRRELEKDARRKGLQEGRQEGLQEGHQERDALYTELLKKLEPLGRGNELLAAIMDRAKLFDLAHEFGLQV